MTQKIKDKEASEFEEVVQNNSLFPCIIVDVDGTIAKMEGRSPYDYTRVIEDTVHWDVVKLIEYYCYGYENELATKPKVIIVSGRKAICKEDTEKWLSFNHIKYDSLYMRASDDTRNDAIVKWEILQEIIKTNRVVMIFDDRDRVVKMFREAGMRVLQVANGNF